MSRPLRPVAPGLIYHVQSRGNNRGDIYLDDVDRVRFLEILTEAVSAFELDSWLYCLMSNHYHLVFRTRLPNLSLAVKHLNGEYVQWWNKRHHRVGHAFQGRFKAQVVEASVYLVRLCRYVLLNPVRGRLCAHPGDWPWNSYKVLSGEVSSDCVDVGSLLRRVDAENSEAVRARLLDYVEPAADPEMAAFIRSDRRVIGTEAFARQFRHQARDASREVPIRERRVATPSLAEILAAAVERPDGLVSGIRHAHESAGYSVAEIVRGSGLSRKTVRRILEGRSRTAPADQGPIVDLTPEGPIADLTPLRGRSQT